MTEPDPSEPVQGELEDACEAFLESIESCEGFDSFAGLPEPDESTAGPVAPGTDGLESFDIQGRIGEGGMGVVYEARQRTALGRRVAVKSLRPFPSRSARERFRREVAAVLKLDHPGIVPVVAADVDGDSPFLAMKFIDGVSLREILHRLRERALPPTTTKQVRPFVELYARGDVGRERAPTATTPGDAWLGSYVHWVAQLALQTCDALQHAHERGVLHRDVKPANIMVTPGGRAVLLDFGIAALLEEEGMTRTGDFVGTLQYSSPEQARGRPVDGRGDVYSVGATLYEALGLQRPFESASSTELLHQVEEAEPPPLSGTVPADLRTICQCALAKDPAERYANPGAMASDLRAFLVGEPIRAKPPGLLARIRRLVKRHPRLLTTAAFVVLFLFALLARDRFRANARAQDGRPFVEHARATSLALRSRTREYVEWFETARANSRVDYAELEARRSELERLREEFAEHCETAEQLMSVAFDHVAGHSRSHASLAELFAVRVEQALFDCEDVLSAASLESVEHRLAAHDIDGRFGGLLDSGGSVRLDSSPTGAKLRVVQGETEFFAGTLPAQLDLPEGSYLAYVEHAGYRPTRYPFLVRRAAVYSADGSARPPNELVVELLPEDELLDGFVYVPAGWTLVDDDPPSWRWVDSFQMGEYELTYREWIDWWNAARDRGEKLRLEQYIPRFRGDPDEPHLLHDSERDEVSLRPGWAQLDWPVRGLTPDLLISASSFFDRPRFGQPGDWYSASPERAEWIRAARGADGRLYPWGDSFSWSSCGGYPSREEPHPDPNPYPVGRFERDVSPFGVRDMAGSVAEITGAYQDNRHGEKYWMGGSYLDRLSGEMRVVPGRLRKNEEAVDLGLRLVARRVPQWLAEPDREPEVFEDDFERADDDVVGRGWEETSAIVLASLRPPAAGDLTSIRAGRLVCEGEVGNHSAAGRVHHRIHVGSSFRARVELAFSTRVLGNARGYGFHLRSDGGSGQTIDLSVNPDGTTFLNYGREPRLAGKLFGVQPDRMFTFEIEVRDRHVEARIWPSGEPRPTEPLLPAVELPSYLGPMRLLTVGGRNLVGGRIEVESVRVTPL